MVKRANPPVESGIMPIRVILDANFLMLVPVFRGNLFEALDTVVGRRTEKVLLTSIYREIQRISLKGNLKSKKQAELTLQFIERKDLRLLDIPLHPLETVDELIIRSAKKWNSVVATNDRSLRQRLLKLGIPVIYLRQGRILEIRGKMF